MANVLGQIWPMSQQTVHTLLSNLWRSTDTALSAIDTYKTNLDSASLAHLISQVRIFEFLSRVVPPTGVILWERPETREYDSWSDPREANRNNSRDPPEPTRPIESYQLRPFNFEQNLWRSPPEVGGEYRTMIRRESMSYLQLAALNDLRLNHRFFVRLQFTTYEWLHFTTPFLATMTPIILESIVRRSLHADRLFSILVSSIVRAYVEASPGRPCVYSASLVSRVDGGALSAKQLKNVAIHIQEYLNPKPWRVAVYQFDTAIRSPQSSSHPVLKEFAEGHHKFPTLSRDSPQLSALKLFCSALLQRIDGIENDALDSPLTPPPCYFGFTRDIRGVSLDGHRADFAMHLVLEFSNFLYPNRYGQSSVILDIIPVCFPFSEQQAQAAQLFFNWISGSTLHTGGGFAYNSNDVALLAPTMANDSIWERNFRWALANTPLAKNMIMETAFWQDVFARAKNIQTHWTRERDIFRSNPDGTLSTGSSGTSAVRFDPRQAEIPGDDSSKVEFSEIGLPHVDDNAEHGASQIHNPRNGNPQTERTIMEPSHFEDAFSEHSKTPSRSEGLQSQTFLGSTAFTTPSIATPSSATPQPIAGPPEALAEEDSRRKIAIEGAVLGDSSSPRETSQGTFLDGLNDFFTATLRACHEELRHNEDVPLRQGPADWLSAANGRHSTERSPSEAIGLGETYIAATQSRGIQTEDALLQEVSARGTLPRETPPRQSRSQGTQVENIHAGAIAPEKALVDATKSQGTQTDEFQAKGSQPSHPEAKRKRSNSGGSDGTNDKREKKKQKGENQGSLSE